jgi:hypothetical protein
MAEEETLEVEGPPPEESSNRLFIILAVLLGSIFIVGLLCIGLYAVFIGPRTASVRQTEAAQINAQNTQIVAQNTQVADQMTQAFLAGQETQIAQAATATEEAIPDTATPEPTNTLVIAPTSTDTPLPTDTPPPTETLSPEQLDGTATAEAEVVGGDVTETVTAGPSPTGPTPTRVASRTPSQVAGTQIAQVTTTGTPGTSVPGPSVTPGPSPTGRATELPDTGFADDVGVPGLIILGMALVAVVIVVRRLRYALRSSTRFDGDNPSALDIERACCLRWCCVDGRRLQRRRAGSPQAAGVRDII